MIYSVVISLILLGGTANYMVGKKLTTQMERRSNRLKFQSYVLLLFIHLVAMEVSSLGYFVLSAFIVLMGGYEIVSVSRKQKMSFRTSLTSLVILGLLASLYLRFVQQQPMEIVRLNFILVISFDAFSQLGGKFFGKTKISAISPNKTWEGFLIGLATCSFLALMLFRQVEIQSIWWETLLTGLLIGTCCFFGDLLASKFKRIAGVKDFSNLLPGQGGVLDRYDSLLATGCCWFILL